MSAYYIDNIRQFNMMGGHQDNSMNNGRGPYTYRLGGQNYHLIGSLLPPEGETAKFSQLYMFCGEDETQDRINVVKYVLFMLMNFFDLIAFTHNFNLIKCLLKLI